MKSKHTLLPLTSLLAAGFAISSANAAITLDASAFSGSTRTGSGVTVTLTGFNATTSDKLVVVAGAASSSGLFTTGITGITYNGVAMTMATRGNTTASGGRATGIYFIDNASMSGTGDIVVTFSQTTFTTNGFQIGAFALSGTATGFDAGSSSNGTGGNGVSATINVAQAGSFVAAVNSYGSFNPSAGMTELGGADPLTRASQLNVAAGSFTATFTGGNVTSVASFAPIPEPSAALLGGLGMLALLRRRR